MASYYSGFLSCEEPHFLESCSLCRKHLGLNSDIFMYRGDKAFCSKECREEQIESDEAKERKWKKSSRSLRKNSSETKESVTGNTVYPEDCAMRHQEHHKIHFNGPLSRQIKWLSHHGILKCNTDGT